MAMDKSQVLSQEEIDALLSGVTDGDVKTEAEDDYDATAIRDYDLRTQDRIIRGRMPTLEMICERFARHFRISMFNMLRRTAEISVQEVKTTKFHEFVHSLYVPSSLNIVRIKPLRGAGLVIFDPKLVSIVVDNYFGGEGRFHTRIEGREFTPTESRIIDMMLKRAFKDLKEAWKPVINLEFQYVNSEVNPQFANIVSPKEIVVVTSYKLELEGGGGELLFVVPYATLEPIRELLAAGVQSDTNDIDERWMMNLRVELERVKLELSCVLGEVELKLGDLQDLKPGSIIPIDIKEQAIVKGDGIPLFTANYGVYKGSNSIKMQSPIANKGVSGLEHFKR